MYGVLLVDDRDGPVLAQFDNAVDGLRTLSELEDHDPDLARALCLVRFDGSQGSIVGTEATTRLRPLT
jgi:hypothetical protein